jgi:dihydroorotate dehydrogenase electron transfer subunit
VAEVDPRRPLHVEGEILASKRAGAYRHLTIAAPGVPERFRAGTFVAVSVGEGRLARRALWIHQVRETGAFGPTLDVVVEPRGEGTRWLAAQPVGARLAVTGPLGHPFALPMEPVSCVLVGEDYASAPLLALAARLRERGCVVSLVVGGETEAHLLSAVEARRSARSVTVVTRDGSVGKHGTVAEHVVDVLVRAEADVVYAAGRTDTLAAVAALAEQHGAWSQVAVESDVTCGTGLCQGCVVPVVGEDGIGRLVRGCVEGPVLRGDRVHWERHAQHDGERVG